MIRPIKKSLLIHSVTLKTISTDKYGQITSSESDILNVRVEPIKARTMINSGLDENDVSKALMFWDKVYSTDATFKTGDRIIFNDVEYTIRKVNLYYARKNVVHHLELELK